ncbi:MAG: PCRF domain-containing protein, partial [Clostridiales bacterium]|nr:PCRF domain-containing protein [Clostridiales bacterium]
MDDFVSRILNHAKKIKARYEELSELISAPEIIADNKLFRRLAAEHASIEETAEAYDVLKKLISDLEKSRAEILSAAQTELRSVYEADIAELESDIELTADRLKALLLPAY